MKHPQRLADTTATGTSHTRSCKIVQDLLDGTGIEINGKNPWDIKVHNAQFYNMVLSQGSLGFGEAYMAGYWDCDALDDLFDRLLRADMDAKIAGRAKMRLLKEVMRAKFINLQSKKRAFQVGEQHYDIGNDVFESMLDPYMIYSCGYWDKAGTLAEAQEHKLDMICRKLQLKPGEKLLEIGCGWGGLMAFATKNYGVEAVGVTVSKEQRQLALERYQGLPIKIELVDYRELTGQFDKIVSVGMFEHVGAKNYRTYFDVARRVLKDDGLFLLHTIGSYATTKKTDAWIDKYIFPNGKIPSPIEITRSVEGKFLIEDWHNFGQDYDRTLMAWYDNFQNVWPRLKEKYGERFYRMWRYYLLCCAGFFRSRQGQLWQIVLSKRDLPYTYRSIRI